MLMRNKRQIDTQSCFEVTKLMAEGWSHNMAIAKVFGSYNTRLYEKVSKFYPKIRELVAAVVNNKRRYRSHKQGIKLDEKWIEQTINQAKREKRRRLSEQRKRDKEARERNTNP